MKRLRRAQLLSQREDLARLMTSNQGPPTAYSSYLIMMRMGPANTSAHLEPLAAALSPATLHVVRPGPRPRGLTAPNIRYWEVKGRFRAAEVLGTLTKGAKVASRCSDLRLVMSFNAYPYGVLAYLVSKFGRKQFHVGYVGSDLRALKSRPFWFSWVKKAALCTTPGVASTEILRRAGYDGRVVELPHGVDTERFRKGNGARDIPCLFVGALIPRKRVDCLIAAMQQIRTGGTGASLVIVGDGPLRGELEVATKQLGLDGDVSFVGNQSNPEAWMKRSKILLMPSEWEGLPYAMIEAMSCGVVPVASPVGSVGDLLIDGFNGRIISNRRPETIARAVTELLNDQERLTTMSMRAVESTQSYTYDSVTDLWRSLLWSIAANEKA